MAKFEKPQELIIEPSAIALANLLYREDLEFLRLFPLNWMLPSSIFLFNDISWTEMKENYNWGFCKGNIFNNLVSWVYIRPDINNKFYSSLVGGIDGLVRKGVINQHYFVVKLKAINYFKSKCNQLLERPISDGDFSSEEENDDEQYYQASSRNPLIDDEAQENNNTN